MTKLLQWKYYNIPFNNTQSEKNVSGSALTTRKDTKADTAPKWLSREHAIETPRKLDLHPRRKHMSNSSDNM